MALASTLLMAPQTDEFGTKVGLLAGLVVVCAARPILDRLVPEPRSATDTIGRFARRLVEGGGAGAGILRRPGRVGLICAGLLVMGASIVAAGTPARGIAAPDITEILNSVPHAVDPATFPSISVGQDVTDWDHTISGPGVQAILLTLAENLQIENQALLRGDPTILPSVDHGDRLIQMQARLQAASAGGTIVIDESHCDAVTVSLLVPFGRQAGLSLGFNAKGTLTEQTYNAGGVLQGQQTLPFAQTFVMSRPLGPRWLNVALLAYGASR